MKIYLSSSWRNGARVRAMATRLRELGHTVFDFTDRPNPVPRDSLPPFVDQPYVDYIGELVPLIDGQIASDIEEIEQCDALILLLPCGSDSHFELGYAKARGKITIVAGQPKPDQFVGMHLMCTDIVRDDFAAMRRLEYY